MKIHGLPGRKYDIGPVVTAAVLLEPNNPDVYSNEAFKISWKFGRPIPKGPNPKMGLKCPYSNRPICKIWTNILMKDVHKKLHKEK
jgi:hypothetical protein